MELCIELKLIGSKFILRLYLGSHNFESEKKYELFDDISTIRMRKILFT